MEYSPAVALLLSNQPIKAASFIVTIYGDAVEPRGEVVWIGNLIEVCAAVGISETLVRTAVSRLVAAGQLVGERSGKRSFYRLASAARAEYASAAKQLFAPERHTGWRFIHLTGSAAEEDIRTLERRGYVRMGARMAFGCRPVPPLGAGALIFNGKIIEGSGGLRDFVAEYADLTQLSDAYRGFVKRFTGIKPLLESSISDALTLRLLLVHEFRWIVLKDPNFPAAALPMDWPGAEARQLFAELYLLLSEEADQKISSTFTTDRGPLRAHTKATDRRERLLLSRLTSNQTNRNRTGAG